MSTQSARPAEFSKRSDTKLLAFQRIATLFLGVIVSSTSFAGAGDLDTTFGEDGRVTTDIGRDHDGANFSGIFPQADGKVILAVGSGFKRYHADGTIDSDYGIDGTVTLPSISIPEDTKGITNVEMTESGKFILAGKSRVLSGFSCTFGSCNDVYTNSYYLSQFNNDGTPDLAFGTNGEVTIDFTERYGVTTNDIINHMAVQDDGRLVIVGYSSAREIRDKREWTNIVRFMPNGELDQSFGIGGIAEVSHSIDKRGRWRAQDFLLQPDGKLLIQKYKTYPNIEYRIVRYNADGSLDDSFGTAGTSEPTGSFTAFTLQEDGKIVLVDNSHVGVPIQTCGFGVERLNADGSIDTSFGVDGQTIVDFGCANPEPIYGIPYVVSIRPDNKIVVAGDTYWVDNNNDQQTTIGFAQLNPDGSLDDSFGVAGKVVLDGFEEGALFVHGLVIQPTGKMQAFGALTTSEFGNDLFGFGIFATNPIVLGLNANGTTDTEFGINGQVIVPAYWSSDDEATDVVAFQGDGKILVGGTTSTFFRGDFALVRYNPNGDLDSTFGVGGQVITDFTLSHAHPCDPIMHTDDLLAAITIQPDGKILAVGQSIKGRVNTWCNDEWSSGIAVVRYHPDGTLDESFGVGGKALLLQDALNPLVSSAGSNIAVHTDGRIIVVGRGGGGYLLAQLHPDGTMDQSFGIGGFSTFNPAENIPGISYSLNLTSVEIQSDGKILATGSFLVTWPPWAGVPSRCNLIRFNQDGSLDTTFGPSGGGLVNYFYGSSICSDLAIQPDGKTVVTGSTINTEPGRTSMAQFSVHRFMTDGSDDFSFGTDGEVKSDFDLSIGPIGGDRAETIDLQADGTILVGGTVANFYRDADQYVHLNKDFGVVRLNADGSHDYSFGDAGKVVTEFGSTEDFGHALAIQADGKILLAGSSSQNYKGVGKEIAIARYEGVSTKLDELDGLILRIQELHAAAVLSDGRAKSLLAKLQAAVQQVDRGNFGAAVNQLGAFVNHVSAFVSGNVLTASQGEILNSEAQRIIEFLPGG